jgi:hypothetical protein
VLNQPSPATAVSIEGAVACAVNLPTGPVGPVGPRGPVGPVTCD